MKKGIMMIAGAWALATIAQAQSAPGEKVQPDGRQLVEKLCGCYEVEFKYAETFAHDTAYKFHDREEISAGLELILPIEVSDKKLVLQHLLVITDSMIIKHWREDWTYENPVRLRYEGNKIWVKESLKPEEVKGQWSQSVWEVSDAPRYQGSSAWIHYDGKTFWQSTADAPLPRREYSVRNDYNILRRTNRIMINQDGWIHEQDNQKIIRQKGTDRLLVEEKGINTYQRTDDSKCAAAKRFWEKNKTFWAKVRAAWEDHIARHSSIELKNKVDGKVLHQYLDELSRELAKQKLKEPDQEARIKAAIQKFIGHEQTVAQH